MNEKIKVCHLITELAIGGAHDNTLLTLEGLDRTKFEPFLITSRKGGFVKRALNGGYSLIFLKQFKREPDFISDFCCLIRLIEIFRQNNFHIVHTHSSKAGVLGRLAAWAAKVPCIVHTVHGWPFNDFMHPLKRYIYQLAERAASKLCHRMLMVCELNKSEALKLKIAPADIMTTVYSGIDFSRIDRINRKISRKIIIERHNINPENQIVGVLARLFPQKAPDVFVNTAKEVLKKKKNVTFIFVGDGPLKEKTEKMICAMGLSENVILAGWQEDVNNYLGSFDVFLLTSLWEGLGRAITEAAYSGVPIVASRVNGVPEIVKKDETGFLFKPGDSAEASKFVLRLLEDSELKEKIGNMSRKKISEQFDIDVMIKKIESIYIEELKIPDYKMQADI